MNGLHIDINRTINRKVTSHTLNMTTSLLSTPPFPPSFQEIWMYLFVVSGKKIFSTLPKILTPHTFQTDFYNLSTASTFFRRAEGSHPLGRGVTFTIYIVLAAL